MVDILFSSAAADELNEQIRSKIASHLFLFCNYAPKATDNLHADAKYYLGILNFYSLAVDSNCILNQRRFLKDILSNDKAQESELREVISEVQMLRGYLAHNNSEKNGRREEMREAEYRNWVNEVIGKQKPATEKDYEALMAKLLEMGEKLYTAIERIIYVVETAPPYAKEKWIGQWEDFTIQWYCGKEIKQDIFLGELENMYIAFRGDLPQNLGASRRFSYQIAGWCKRFCAQYRDMLENVLENWPQEEQPKGIQEKMEVFKRQLSEIQACDKEFDKSRNFNGAVFKYQKCLFVILRDMLPDTLHEKKCTMLPDDLLQEQIQILFAVCAPRNYEN